MVNFTRLLHSARDVALSYFFAVFIPSGVYPMGDDQAHSGPWRRPFRGLQTWHAATRIPACGWRIRNGVVKTVTQPTLFVSEIFLMSESMSSAVAEIGE